MKSTNDIRAGFLEFFRKNGHEVRPSGPLVPHNDPTLMFANAGMNQFKNVFTGVEKLPYSRAATSQKCVRAGGKHNDLDNVGYTARHHTFFEMLGNFSFGDYFKETAIELAWNLLTKDFAINPDKLCVTVYHDDDVAWSHWKKLTGFPDHKIIRIATSDNFWSMGDTGPCGPCSEIFYDHGENIPGGPPGSPDADGDRFVEIWNLVFMQYEQLADGKRIDLPKPSIDTGMGLERIAAVMQGVHDNYRIDLFRHIIHDIIAITDEAVKGSTVRETLSKAYDREELLGNIGTGRESATEAAYKVIADHLRSSCFLIADGVMPSNEGRGYVLRRIMRRAMRYAHQLGCKDPLMYRLVPSLIREMGEAYPELIRAQATITDNLRQEEERFKQTLERGLKLLEEETAKIGKGRKLPGDAAFKLYDTYGFPLDLTQDILRGRGIEVDTDGFEKAMEGQREMARAAWSGSGEKATGKIWFELKEKLGPVEFLGYDADEADASVKAIVKDNEPVQSAKADDEVYVILDRTPFYGESGGQMGDTGLFRHPEHSEGSRPAAQDPSPLAQDDAIARILDTQKPLDDFIVHKAKLSAPLKVGDTVHAVIDVDRRNAIRANHSATHLLHKALRDKLGEHVTQKGSLVAPDRLRFDFSHPKAVSREEITEIEANVNAVIRRNTPVACKVMAPDDAIKAGAMALFGEKYGDRVRVLSMGISEQASGISKESNSPNAQSLMPNPYSVELCGGTHVRTTGDIGLFKITSEGSVASGIRRIEAVTGEGVRDYLAGELEKSYRQLHALEEGRNALVQELKDMLVTHKAELAFTPQPQSIQHMLLEDAQKYYDREIAVLESRIAAQQEENKKLSKQLAEAKKQQALSAGGDVTPEKIGNVTFIGKIFDNLDPKELRGIAENYRHNADIVAVGTAVEGKASVVVAVGKSLAGKFSAVPLVQAAVAELGGKGGGGKPDMAQGGGPDAGRLDAALHKIKSLVQ